MKEENIGVLSAGERFGFKGFEWIVLDNNVDGGVLAIMASAWNNEEYSFDDDGCNNYANAIYDCLLSITLSINCINSSFVQKFISSALLFPILPAFAQGFPFRS